MNLTDENLKKIKFEVLSNFNSDCWIAGGAITDFILGRKIRDIDVFFPSEKDALKAKNKLTSIGGKMTFEYPQGFNVKYRGTHYDLAFVGATAQETIDRFDYTVCAIAVDKNKKFIHHEDYFNHLEKMELHYIGNHPNKFYLNKAKRLLKYFDKGFSLDQDNLEKWLHTLIKDHKKAKRKF
jgi:tRNA nucleotidyltransferase/poly(A) polymerase